MKKLFLVLLVLVSFFSNAQPPILASGGNLVSSNPDSALIPGQQIKLSADTSKKFGFAKLGSVLYYYDGFWKVVISSDATKLNIADSLSKYVTPKNLKDSTNSLRLLVESNIDTTVLFSKIRGFAKFQTKVFDSINNRKINVRLIGTSISLGNSYANIFLTALESKYGKSNSGWSPFATQSELSVNGWKTQYYGGLYNIRLKGRSDSASAYTFFARGKNLIIYYSKDTDGGVVSVSVTSIAGTTNHTFDCNGTKTYGNYIILPLDQYQDNSISITAPASGYGYLESYIINSVQKGGIFQFNASYGGSGIGNAGGTWQRNPLVDMYATDIPIGNMGLISTFAPTDSFAKPDLVIYSGFTNDFGNGVANFTNNLTTAVDLAVANGSSAILCIEPVNGQASITEWAKFRKVYYDLAKKYPENVSVYDWELLMTPSLKFNPKYHWPELSDPHPGDFGFGSPHAIGGADFAKTYGIANDVKLIDYSINESLSSTTISGKEPLYAPLGSWWTDTSVSKFLNKRLVSRPIFGSKGVWETTTFLNKNIVSGFPSTYGGSFFTNDTNSLNQPCIAISANTAFGVTRTNFTVGKTYTISFNSELTLKNALFVVGVVFGNSPFYLLDSKTTNTFKFSASNVTDVIYGLAGVKKNIYTFTMPSDAEMTAAGISLSGNGAFLTIRIGGGNNGSKTRVWDFKIEEGASATNFVAPYVYQMANTTSLLSVTQSTEPNTNTFSNGSGWVDTSNTSPSYKVLYDKQTVKEFGITQLSNIWQQAVPNVNLIDNFIDPSIITIASGGSITKGNEGLNGIKSIKIVTTTGNSNNSVEISSAIGQVQMEVNKTYTLSFLVKSNINDLSNYSTNLQFYMNLRYLHSSGNSFYLDASRILQTTSSGAGLIFSQSLGDNNFYRAKLTFKMGPALPGAISANYFQIRIGAFNNTTGGGATHILSDFKLEEGAGVTNSTGAGNLGFALANNPTFTGVVKYSFATLSANASLTASNTSITGGTTFPLPDATTNAGKEYTVINSTSGSIAITTVSSQLIGNFTTATTFVMPSETSNTFLSNGTKWLLK